MMGSRTETPRPPAPPGSEPQSTSSHQGIYCPTQNPSILAAELSFWSSFPLKGEEVPSGSANDDLERPHLVVLPPDTLGRAQGRKQTQLGYLCHLSLKSVQGLIVLSPGV